MNLLRESRIGEYIISTDKTLLDIDYIHDFISNKSYWAKGIPKNFIETSIENSLTFGVYHEKKQIGFARLVTDYATFGYLADVFIDEEYRGQSLSKKLMEFVFGMEELRNFRRMILATRDAHSLYEKYGFTPLKDPSRFMEKAQPDIYTKLTPLLPNGKI
jgi:GNAT superfamily N-acetyltransferase